MPKPALLLLLLHSTGGSCAVVWFRIAASASWLCPAYRSPQALGDSQSPLRSPRRLCRTRNRSGELSVTQTRWWYGFHRNGRHRPATEWRRSSATWPRDRSVHFPNCLLQLELCASRLRRSHIQHAGTGQQVNGDSAPGVSHQVVEDGHQYHHHHHLATYSHPWEHRIFQGKPVPDHIR